MTKKERKRAVIEAKGSLYKKLVQEGETDIYKLVCARERRAKTWVIKKKMHQ